MKKNKLSDNMEKQALFRLGQMDIRASVTDMLQAAADGCSGVVISTLLAAVDQVKNMEVLHE